MNLSTSVDEGYRELIARAEEDVLRRLTDYAAMENAGRCLTDKQERRRNTLHRWLDDLDLLRNRETIEQGRRCA